MKKNVLLTIISTVLTISVNAQNTTFNNVSIGLDAPVYGVKIKANFPGVTSGWARGFSIANETGDQNYITLGTFGGTVNGVSSINNSYIGTDWNNQYMTFLPNGNIGVGTTNPRAHLDVAKHLSENQIGTIFGRLPEGDTIGSGTFLGVRGYATQGPDDYNVKSFSIVHDFYGQTNSSVNFYRGGSILGGFITFNTSDNTEKMRIWSNGNVGIGTTNPTSKLTVAGNIASREVKVTVDAGADFVFEKDYDLPSLESVDKFIKENKHLPEIASAQEMQKDGINLSEMNIKLLQKIEELTLYVIEMKKENEFLKNNQKVLEKRIDKIEKK